MISLAVVLAALSAGFQVEFVPDLGTEPPTIAYFYSEREDVTRPCYGPYVQEGKVFTVCQSGAKHYTIFVR